MQYGSPQGPAQYGAYPGAMYDSPPPKRKTKKRIAVIAAVSAACLASAGVYATTLSVTANMDSAGTDVVASCDTNGVTTQTSDVLWDDTLMDFKITTITVSGIDPDACLGQSVYVQPMDADDHALGADDIAAQTVTGTGTVEFTNLDVPLNTFEKVTVAIHES